jgi:hypothetical protein
MTDRKDLGNGELIDYKVINEIIKLNATELEKAKQWDNKVIKTGLVFQNRISFTPNVGKLRVQLIKEIIRSNVNPNDVYIPRIMMLKTPCCLKSATTILCYGKFSYEYAYVNIKEKYLMVPITTNCDCHHEETEFILIEVPKEHSVVRISSNVANDKNPSKSLRTNTSNVLFYEKFGTTMLCLAFCSGFTLGLFDGLVCGACSTLITPLCCNCKKIIRMDSLIKVSKPQEQVMS